jgi:hypothetical protein
MFVLADVVPLATAESALLRIKLYSFLITSTELLLRGMLALIDSSVRSEVVCVLELKRKTSELSRFLPG